MTHADTALVVTSIAAPNDCLKALAAESAQRGVRFIVIGDRASPKDFELTACDFYTPPRQEALTHRYAAIAPWRHYARKNIGYLEAVRSGAARIHETDDDNFPLPGFWLDQTHDAVHEARGSTWFNLYQWYGTDAWPRGFPLRLIKAPQTAKVEKVEAIAGHVAVWQGLVANDPDVDAIFRMTRREEVQFQDHGAVVLGAGVWCPFNSQNTCWEKAAFPLLYLPATCSFRATDIIRSYVALRCLEAMGMNLAFTGVTARQIRNEHDLMKDFRDEIAIYLHAEAIRESLNALRLSNQVGAASLNVRRCYEALINMGVVNEGELPLLDAWSADLARAPEA